LNVFAHTHGANLCIYSNGDSIIDDAVAA
jgi:hypothetical protein